MIKTVCKWFAALSIVAALSACAPLMTQSPGGPLSPVNAISDGEDKHLILFGHDVVAYFTEGKHRLGSAQFKSKVGEVTFRFATAEHKALFDKDPAKYTPQFGGYCANGLVYGIPWGGDADTWTIVDGKLYIFGGQGSKDGFMVDQKGNLALAEKYWLTEVAGSNAFVQRNKRLVMKVPLPRFAKPRDSKLCPCHHPRRFT
jgi:YHS domain-containing protein